MNRNGIRTDLAAALASAGFGASPFVPEDATELTPEKIAAVVNPPHDTNYSKSWGFAEVKLSVTLAVARVTNEAAELALDNATSTGTAGSAVDAIKAATSPYWQAQTIHVDSCGPVYESKSGTVSCLACDLEVSLLSTKA